MSLDFDSITEKMLYGLFYGYAVAECLWEVSGSMVALSEIKVRKQRRFGFAPDGALKLLTSTSPMGEVVPARKFWHFRCGADNDDEPYGLGLAHWLYWPTYFKRNSIEYWVNFLNKFAQPSVIGEYDVAASETDKKRLLASVAAVQSQAGIIIPNNMVVRLLEASRSGRADYADLPEIMDQAIARVILTQTMTSSDGSSLSQAQVHERMLGKVVQADGNLISSSFNRSVAKWLTEWNFPGAITPRLVFMTEEPDDLDKRAVREKVIFDTTGLRPTKKHIEEVYGGEWEMQPTPQPPSTPPTPPPDAKAQFAEGRDFPDQQAIDDVSFDGQLQPVVEQWLQPILARLQEGATPEELLDWLGEMYPKMNYQGLVDLLDRAVFIAETWGRIGVANEQP